MVLKETLGTQPIGTNSAQEQVYLGLDGQLWAWRSGQSTVARSGNSALSYAENELGISPGSKKWWRVRIACNLRSAHGPE